MLFRSNVSISDMANYSPSLKEVYTLHGEDVCMQAEILLKYDGYIGREKDAAEKVQRLEHYKFSSDFDYYRINSLSLEAREKLN